MKSIGIIGVLIAMVIALLLVSKRLTAPVVPSSVADQVEESTGERPQDITDLSDVARDRQKMMERRNLEIEAEINQE